MYVICKRCFVATLVCLSVCAIYIYIYIYIYILYIYVYICYLYILAIKLAIYVIATTGPIKKSKAVIAELACRNTSLWHTACCDTKAL